MKIVQGQTFLNEAVELDDTIFADCVFQKCKLITSGGEVQWINTRADKDTIWVFVGAAGRTFAILRDWLGWRPLEAKTEVDGQRTGAAWKN